MSLRLLVLLCCAVLSMACQRAVDGSPAPTSFLDTLPLGLARVQQISGFDRLERVADSDQPWPDAPTLEGPCRSYSGPAAYGDVWTALRRVADDANLVEGPVSPIVSIAQVVVAYPDVEAARQALNRRIEDARACVALNTVGLSGSVSHLNDDSAMWVSDGSATMFRIKSSILVEISVVGLPDDERIASDISHSVLARIP